MFMIESSNKTETYNPYQIAKIINEGCIQHNREDLVIRPQMMYNYASKGMINGVEGCKQYSYDEVVAFITRFMTKKINKIKK